MAHLHEDWNLDELRDALRTGHHAIVGVERHLLGYLANEHNRTVIERHERVELSVICDDNRPTKATGKRQTKRVGKGDSMRALKRGGFFPERRVMVISCDNASVSQ